MMTKIGERVGVVLSVVKGEANFLGYGVYMGDKPCPTLGGMANPKLLLDDGSVAWGCETWWGPEAVIKKKIEEGKIVQYEIERDATGAYVNAHEKV